MSGTFCTRKRIRLEKEAEARSQRPPLNRVKGRRKPPQSFKPKSDIMP